MGTSEHDELGVLSGESDGAVQREGRNLEQKLRPRARCLICPHNSDDKSSVSRRYGVKRASGTPMLWVEEKNSKESKTSIGKVMYRPRK